MAEPPTSYFRRLFAYERDSNAKSLASVDTIPQARRGEPGYQRALDLHTHIALARLMWLHRLGAEPVAPASYHMEGLAPADVRALVDRMERGWAEYLERLPEDGMDEEIEYESVASGRFRSSLSDIFTHLAGHAWYVRGQIASVVRASGGTPAMTDHMFWSREPVK